MDIYSYINSRDIAEHCKKIGHIFNPLEMAVIIEHSEKTVKGKHIAWRELIADYPDMSIRESNCFDACDSLHDYLHTYIVWEEKWIESFFADDGGGVYHFECGYGTNYSSNVQTALAAVIEYLDNDKDAYGWIRKKRLDTDGSKTDDAVRINSDGEIIRYDYSADESCPDSLGNIFIHVPIPFERGDLVSFRSGEYPSVLANSRHWQDDYEDLVSGKCGNGSCMQVGCYHFGDGDKFIYEWSLPFQNTLHLRYFNGELKGNDRFLKHLSRFLKGETNRLDWLINVFLKFKGEADCEDANWIFGIEYSSIDDEDYDIMNQPIGE